MICLSWVCSGKVSCDINLTVFSFYSSLKIFLVLFFQFSVHSFRGNLIVVFGTSGPLLSYHINTRFSFFFLKDCTCDMGFDRKSLLPLSKRFCSFSTPSSGELDEMFFTKFFKKFTFVFLSLMIDFLYFHILNVYFHLYITLSLTRLTIPPDI